MGQTYCSQLCGERTDEGESPIELIHNDESNEPKAEVARKVRQHIELHAKVKQTYMLYRTPHKPEKKGTKLDLYYLFDFAAYYEGEWKDGLPHGFGRIIYDDGSMYEGCFSHGVAQCQHALFIKHNGSFYRGSIKGNKAQGYGQLSTNKLFYKGYWQNDVPHGKGREIYSSISFYEGEFRRGVKEGEGIYQWNQHEYYIGSFQANALEGSGDLITKDSTFKGHFKAGKKEGQGRELDHSQRFEYFGNFSNNKPSGQGEIVYADGTTFKGTFDGLQNRKGILELTCGQRIELDSQQQEIESEVQQSQKEAGIQLPKKFI